MCIYTIMQKENLSLSPFVQVVFVLLKNAPCQANSVKERED